ncbi:MAG: colanic acid biosynthesis glycosyltransferase WcaL [Leptolyngbyaceae cyanobacterium SL_7_1]|nr:colanic acid biosynthesis glycosyltransferase WcaL [Leptolyngbyaceae cyanobacterium SL_7_1]
MKIAFFVDRFPALSETFILNQITGLIDRGHEVDIYADRSDGSTKVHPDVDKYNLLEKTTYVGKPDHRVWRLLKIAQLPLWNFVKQPAALLQALNVKRYGKQASSLTLLYSAAHMLGKDRKYDIIQTHFGPNGLEAVFLREMGVIQGKIATQFHGYDLSEYVQRYGREIYRELFKQGNVFLPISHHMKSRLIELGCDKNRINVHHVGVELERFNFTPRTQPIDGVTQLITIARFVEKKGLEYGIRAVAALIKAGINVTYSIVGDGDRRQALQALIDSLGVGDRIKLLGWKPQPEVIQLLNQSHIMLVPSVTSHSGDQEGIPTVLIEAAMLGLPVVSTEHSGIPEVVHHEISGFLVPERDVDALAEQLGYLIQHPELWAEMGRSGRSIVEEQFDIDRLNTQLIAIYTDLVHSNLKSTVMLSASSYAN